MESSVKLSVCEKTEEKKHSTRLEDIEIIKHPAQFAIVLKNFKYCTLTAVGVFTKGYTDYCKRVILVRQPVIHPLSLTLSKVRPGVNLQPFD